MSADFPKSKYQIIYVDPPWSYDDKSLNRGGAERHYRTMTNEDICRLPAASIADENCALFVWATFPKLFEAKEVIDAWGFLYKTCAFVWVKSNRSTEIGQSLFFPEEPEAFWGMGRWTRSNAEICLLAIKGEPKRISGGVHQIVYEPIDAHSKKPPVVRERIVQLLGDLPRIELFARNTSQGWDCWGNEAPKELLVEKS